MFPRIIRLGLPLLVLLLAGCSAVLTQGAGAGAGVAGAAVANAVTSNGAVTAGIGLGAQAAAIAGVQYMEKRVHGAEQDAIASAAGPLAPGEIGSWRVSHDIPIENNEHGELTVVSDFTPALPRGNLPAFDCKLVIFSVDTMDEHHIVRDFYTTYVCRDGAQWQWAQAEPATARWGALQ